jgi:hypothetical protein
VIAAVALDEWPDLHDRSIDFEQAMADRRR